MSRAFKCDLCNTLFEPISGATRYVKDFTTPVLVDVEIKTDGKGTSMELDVCPSCLIQAMECRIARLRSLLSKAEKPKQKTMVSKESPF